MTNTQGLRDLASANERATYLTLLISATPPPPKTGRLPSLRDAPCRSIQLLYCRVVVEFLGQGIPGICFFIINVAHTLAQSAQRFQSEAGTGDFLQVWQAGNPRYLLVTDANCTCKRLINLELQHSRMPILSGFARLYIPQC